MHNWMKTSGTTSTCTVCGCRQYHENEHGDPAGEGSRVSARYAIWKNGRWVGYTNDDPYEPPVCDPARGPYPFPTGHKNTYS